jgi:hypothetical protein
VTDAGKAHETRLQLEEILPDECNIVVRLTAKEKDRSVYVV